MGTHDKMIVSWVLMALIIPSNILNTDQKFKF